VHVHGSPPTAADLHKGGVANGRDDGDPRNKSSHALNLTANVWFSPTELEGKFPVSALIKT